MHCCRCEVFVLTRFETRIVILLNCHYLNANEFFRGLALVPQHLPVHNARPVCHSGTFGKVGMGLRHFSCDKIFFKVKFS